MNLAIDPLAALKYAAIVLCGVGIVGAVSALAASRTWAGYTGYLDRTLRLLFLDGSAQVIVRVQVALLAAIAGARLALGDIPYWYAFAALVALSPAAYLSLERRKRIAAIDGQLDSFLMALANSLKTVPNPAAALQATVPLLHDPLRQEVERVVKELRVGNTLEQALASMSSRVGSRALDAAMSSIIIGLQVGGNLPFALEGTAATVREMNRLAGVVRTKTGEGRAQLWVLAIAPFGMCAAFNWLSPGYFDPLKQSFSGYVIVSIATVCWLASLLVARSVLKVDI